MVNMYLHPLSSATAIIMRDIPGVILAQEVNIPAALFCIGILSIKMILSFFKIYLLDGIGIFFAIAPVIAVVSRIKKGYWLALIFTVIYSFAGLFTSISDVLSACYPITATFNISGYYSATFGEIIISLMSLFFCGLFSVLILISKKTIKNK